MISQKKIIKNGSSAIPDGIDSWMDSFLKSKLSAWENLSWSLEKTGSCNEWDSLQLYWIPLR